MGKIRGEIGGEVHGTVGDVTISTWQGMKGSKGAEGPGIEDLYRTHTGPIQDGKDVRRDS